MAARCGYDAALPPVGGPRVTWIYGVRNILVPVLALLALPFLVRSWGGAAAQPAEDWSQIETVEVKAQPGPAVWHLTRGSSEVWILGTVGPMPSDLAWNRQYLSDLVDGARAILMPPRASIGLLEGAWFLITNGSKLSLPRGQTLEAGLPEALRRRFAATRTAIGRDEDRYKTDTPIRAAIRLQTDFQDKTKIYGWEPNATLRDLSRSKHVPIGAIARYEVVDAFKEVLNLNLAQQQACLGQAVEDVDRLSAHAAAAAHAWAVGDIKTVEANYAESRLYDCVIAAVQHVADLNERNVADTVAAIDAALNKPGKTIVVVQIGPLLRRNGVLQRLQAMHLPIEGPAG
jgi:hypothetical protein